MSQANGSPHPTPASVWTTKVEIIDKGLQERPLYGRTVTMKNGNNPAQSVTFSNRACLKPPWRIAIIFRIRIVATSVLVSIIPKRVLSVPGKSKYQSLHGVISPQELEAMPGEVYHL
jgi:hypothetical protein